MRPHDDEMIVWWRDSMIFFLSFLTFDLLKLIFTEAWQTDRWTDRPMRGCMYYLSKKNCPTLCKSPFIDQDNTIWLLRWWLVFFMVSPRAYHCRHAPWHAFVEIFEVLCSEGPPDLLCHFDDSCHGRTSVVGELFGYLLMGKAILMKDNYRFLLPQG